MNKVAVNAKTANRAAQPRRMKHVPMRTCVGTNTKHPKREMVRIVQTADGHVVVDPTGKLGGSRGAYVSKSSAAAEAALKNRRLEAEFELQQPISQADAEAILSYFKQFDKAVTGLGTVARKLAAEG